MTGVEKAKLVIETLDRFGLEPWDVATACDVTHLEKSYEAIKENPAITREEFLEKVDLTAE